MKLPILCSLLLLSQTAAAVAYKPFHVLSLSGTASLTRFEDEAFPMEAGQDLPGDFTLSLEKGAVVSLRSMKRVDLTLKGPAQLRSFLLEHDEGQVTTRELVLRLESGELTVDPSFLLGHASHINLDLPDTSYDIVSGAPYAVIATPGHSKRRELGLSPEPVPMLLLARDYDSELKTWARPAILGPALMGSLQGVSRLALVEGSGSTLLAAFANAAIRSGKDYFLQQMARDRGARFVIVGNLVSEQLRENPRNPLMQAVAEVRVLEALDGGDVLVSEVSTTLMARAGRSLEIVGPRVMRGATQRIGTYVRDAIEGLLRGEAHPNKLLKASFNGVKPQWWLPLRQGLGGLPTVQRFFKRGYSSGVFRADIILRKDEAEFVRELEALDFKGFRLEAEKDAKAEGLLYTLRPKPTPVVTPTRTKPKEWRR